MTPLDYYRSQVENQKISFDPEQFKIMEVFNQIQANLLKENRKRNAFFAMFRQPQLVKGLYLWGGVGIGKTFMMDCFYHTLPFKEKMRIHFHSFMQKIHTLLKEYQGEKDPLKGIAKKFAEDIQVICFDEFFVSDITDAMILGRLLKALFQEGVSLITTSNVAPDDLYKNGLQRSQFLPAIALIKEATLLIHSENRIDYRLRHLKEAGVFYTPLTEDVAKKMEKSFDILTEGKAVDTSPIFICDRFIPVKKRAGNVIWFDFRDLCHIPRSQHDYLAIAKEFRTVFISDVPEINANEKDTICLFISMVDVFYDAKVRLVISAAEPVEQLYSRGYMIVEYARTHSRLLEMQSEDYFNPTE